MSTHTMPRHLTHRASRAVAAFALLGGLMTIATSAPAAAVTGACLPGQVGATATVSSLPGGTTAQLVMTSQAFPNCWWAVPTGYQFVNSAGAAIGPVVYPTPHPAVTRWVPLNYGFQVVVRVTTMSGVNCTTQIASKVRVTVPGRVTPLDVTLPSTIGVCVGGTTAWTSVTETRLTVPHCDAGQLALSIGAPSGAAGTSYYPLRVRNTATVACAIWGIPLVRAWATPTGAPVGPVARRLSLPGYGAMMRLAPGASASVALGVGNVGNWPATRCSPATARALQVSVSGVRLVVPVSFQVCTRVASLSVRGWVPGLSGQV